MTQRPGTQNINAAGAFSAGGVFVFIGSAAVRASLLRQQALPRQIDVPRAHSQDQIPRLSQLSQPLGDLLKVGQNSAPGMRWARSREEIPKVSVSRAAKISAKSTLSGSWSTWTNWSNSSFVRV